MEERPVEWLRSLDETPGAYAALVKELGLAISAWKIAWARCRSAAVSTTVPTRAEVKAAARCIAPEHPGIDAIVGDCEAAGLLVI